MEHGAPKSESYNESATRRWIPTSIATAVANTVIVLLVAVDIVRTLRHVMWRDKMVVFLVALSSSSLWDLWPKLQHQRHPALWYTLVWFITRVTSDPTWMQILHIGLAIGVWVIIYAWSPFSRLEKILLLLSYFLFWEYFVISRDYALIALIVFGFIALRERRPRPEFVLWLLLGLLANVHVFGAIWSMTLAAMLALEAMRRRTVPAAGAAVYLVLLVFAIASMMPEPNFHPFGHEVGFEISRLNTDIATPIGAFVPLTIESIRNAFAFIAHPRTAAIPQFWNINSTADFRALMQADTDHPVRMASMFAAPIAACWIITRNALLTLEFTLMYFGMVLFQNIWWYPDGARHYGVVFLAFIAVAWAAFARQSPTIWSRSLFTVILLVNACGGVLSLSSELRPFSESYDTAAWVRQNYLARAFLIGSHDAQAWSVTGYLERPIYYLECECSDEFGTEGNEIFQPASRRIGQLSSEEFGRRLTKAVVLAGQHDAILIRNRPVTADDLKSGAPGLSATLLKSFTNAMTDENFWIYRMSMPQTP
jgi:hypothetical protein